MQKTYSSSPIDGKRESNRGELPMYVIDNHHEPLIDEDTYNRVQEILEKRMISDGHRGYANASIFTSKILCTKCQKHYRRGNSRSKAKHSSKANEIIPYWKCQSDCRKSRVRESELIKEITDILEMPTFDEDKMWVKLDRIEAHGNRAFTFYLKDGSVVHREIISKAKKEVWTQELRAYKSKSSILSSRKRFSEFTCRIKCEECGNYYKHTNKNDYWTCYHCKDGRREYHDVLQQQVQKALNLKEYTTEVVKDTVEDFIAKKDGSLTAILKDGKEVLIHE